MASVSLNDIGNTQLGGSGSVNMKDLPVNMFTRTLSTAGYKRTNPFESTEHTPSNNDSAPHNLNEWEFYLHTRVDAGKDLSVEMGYGEMTVSWTRGNNYQDNCCRQVLYIKAMGTAEDLSVNPFSSPSASPDVSDVSQYTIAGTSGQYYAIGLKAFFDDSVTEYGVVDSLACDYSTASGTIPLTGAGRGISSSTAVWADTPSIDSISQDPGSTSCFGSDTPDVDMDVTMNGTSLGTLQRNVNGGSWTNVSTSVTAGASALTDTNRSPGNTYNYRLKYNDVSPESWSATKSIFVDCELI